MPPWPYGGFPTSRQKCDNSSVRLTLAESNEHFCRVIERADAIVMHALLDRVRTLDCQQPRNTPSKGKGNQCGIWVLQRGRCRGRGGWGYGARCLQQRVEAGEVQRVPVITKSATATSATRKTPNWKPSSGLIFLFAFNLWHEPQVSIFRLPLERMRDP